ncbi:MAG: glycosyl hydrolase 53 family protein [Bacteroidales bacterium]|jgi:arabinogalactan endo-1,4-beta-galactosidase
MKKITYSLNIIIVFIWILFLNCIDCHAQFVKGADVGWLSQMEATGYKFYDTTGVQTDCLEILQERHINTIRLRVWVNPSNDRTNGHCSKKEVAAMALRAKNMGMRILIDFHYSDSWADPGKQNKPAAWANDTFSQLLTDLYNHTFEVLDTLKSIGALPDWVQVGNEITGGMLWPDGSTSNWGQLAQLLNKGYDAVKAVDSAIKVIIHIDDGNDNSRFRTFFDNATNYGVRYDIIGASYYPYWNGSDYTVTIGDLGNNLNDMTNRYGKEVMVVETGGLYYNVQNTYDMLTAVINKVNNVPSGMGLGVVYWEPEGELSWSGYSLSSWDSIAHWTGEPTHALNAFMNQVSKVENPTTDSFKIYPNPTKGLLNVSPGNNMPGAFRFSVINETGEKVLENILQQDNNIIDLTKMISGAYLITIFDKQNNIITSKEIIKQ